MAALQAREGFTQSASASGKRSADNADQSASKVAALPTKKQRTSGHKQQRAMEVLLEDAMAWDQVKGRGVMKSGPEVAKMVAHAEFDDEEFGATGAIDWEPEDTDFGGAVDTDHSAALSIASSTDSDTLDGVDDVESDTDASLDDLPTYQMPSQSNRGRADDRNVREFYKYCTNAKKNFVPFTKDEARAVRLLDALRKNKAPLAAYDDFMRLILRETGDLLPNEPLGDCPSFIGRRTMMKMLTKRYNMKDKFPFIREIVLPNSAGTVANVVCHDPRHCVEMLLTNPRLKDSDFAFFDNDPFAPPPKDPKTVSELNTGLAYRQAHAAFVTKPNQIGVGAQFYADGAVTGQFDNLQILIVKMTLSIFTREYRMKDEAWATVGYVVNYSHAKATGRALLVESQHDQAEAIRHEVGDRGGRGPKISSGREKAQDFHAQLEAILKSYLPLEANGMLWDLVYRGKLYRNCELVFWTVMVKCDTDEAEMMTGKYRSRTGNVKQLCRYCTCPNEETDNHLADYPYKTVEMVDKLIRNKDKKGLKAISQQYIDNAWYKVRFNPADGRGIHGATPSEMLHALLLGIFKYTRECFFDQIGESSQLAKEIDGLAAQYGDLFARQSERDLPKCKFGHGIRKKGKLMAKEYRGVLLVIAAVLRSEKGRELLSENPNFATPEYIKDWLLLVEMLLQWEAYLCEPEMKVKHVQRLQRKNRYIMYLIKKVARRSQGMGLKLMKYHAIVHMATDIILYGVPMEHDTGAQESGHKVTKVAAKLTQKKLQTFEKQTATRLVEFLIIQLAKAELDGYILWEYFDQVREPDDTDSYPSPSSDSVASHNKQDKTVTGGARLVVYLDGDENPTVERITRKKDPKPLVWNDDILSFLLDLQDLLADWTDADLQIRTEHRRNGAIFRAHPDYREDGRWQDWALVDWGDDYGHLPCEIWCFVVVDCIPEDEQVEFGGVMLENGTYAVVETSQWNQDLVETKKSDIFKPFIKDYKKANKEGKVTKRQYYLADVEAIVSPMCVVADVGSKPACKYFHVLPRGRWVADFIAWVEDPYRLDDMNEPTSS